MTNPHPPSIVQNSNKSSGVSGCLVTALIFSFAILGAHNLVLGSVIAYIFSSAHIFSPLNIAIVFIIAGQCLIYFWLVFRIRRQHWLVSLALVAAVWLVLSLPLHLMINVSTARVRNDGFSMGASLPSESYILADRLAYQQNQPERGDVVLFSFPLDPGQDLIKRVIGLPGETVEVTDGTVTIDGVPLEEPYITEPPLYHGTWFVPEGQFFVLGDNRNESKDSHQWEFLPRENIIAKAVWIYYPLDYFGRIVDVNYQP